MRKMFIAGNWKLNKTARETAEFAASLRRALPPAAHTEIAVFPAHTSLAAAVEALRGSSVGVGAQDVAWEDSGAFTGEVSGAMLKEAGCRYVIIGHSERRQLFGETDKAVNRKLAAALRHGLTPIVCVGETLAERDANRTLAVLDWQLKEGLKGFTAEQAAGWVLAYEPVWAIGTGRNATPQQAQEAQAFIRGFLIKQFGQAAEAMRIQYGGSVKPDNAAELLSQPDVDGALVGGASLEVAPFVAIILAAERAGTSRAAAAMNR
ncbi:MAG: triose-phosphate isomerase [Candidatus Omnitrophica bacterium]|nr:triose-phosphate isomerase [Candidatus Omnitrophota bacterium]